MGGSFNPKMKNYDCGGQQVAAKLNQVFKDPGTPPHLKPKFQYAKDHNTFDQVPLNKTGNWQKLLDAYTFAGVNVGSELAAWTAYLEDLGAGGDGEPGPQQISAIASMRYNALINNTGIDTKTHPHGHVQTSAGVIDSPCPL